MGLTARRETRIEEEMAWGAVAGGGEALLHLLHYTAPSVTDIWSPYRVGLLVGLFNLQ